MYVSLKNRGTSEYLLTLRRGLKCSDIQVSRLLSSHDISCAMLFISFSTAGSTPTESGRPLKSTAECPSGYTISLFKLHNELDPFCSAKPRGSNCLFYKQPVTAFWLCTTAMYSNCDHDISGTFCDNAFCISTSFELGMF